MMNESVRSIRATMLLTGLLAAGCADGKYFQMAKTAEQKGDAAAAYDYYCRAGAKQRNGAIAAGLARTRADAAAQSERAGLAAMDEGRYDDAWRLFMRTLEIQPDHTTAVQLVRKLESEHPTEIAATQHEWMMNGALALHISRRETPSTVQRPSTTATPNQAMTKAEPALASAPPSTSLPQTPAPSSRGEVTETSSNFKDVRQEREAASPPPIEPSARASDSRPIAPPGRGEFLGVLTLSLKDRRYPRMVVAVDGIAVKLRDTDADGEVDMDLFDGKKRVQKVRDLELNRSQTFRGKSGDLYRLTLLGVHHKSETVKIGVKRA